MVDGAGLRFVEKASFILKWCSDEFDPSCMRPGGGLPPISPVGSGLVSSSVQRFYVSISALIEVLVFCDGV